MTKVFIDGAAGTTGLEIGARLADRDDLTLVMLDDARRKDPAARREALNEADLVVLCLPDEAAKEAVALIDNPAVRVIDASSAHRVAEGWTYGLPELGIDVATARRVANPGCWPSGFLALVRPLVAAGLVPADWPLTYSGASGYSGGGKAMIAEFESGEAQTGFRAYGLALTHKHLPEMQAHAGLAFPPVFLPAVANVYRGMIGEVGLVLRALPARPSLADVRDVLAAAYPAGGIIRVSDETPATLRIEADAGTDRMTLYVLGHADQARLIATYDNLGKGAAGAAVQSLNLMTGAEPTRGLVL
ncbi:N-acetyl-gamma-glutamyl-phosphate reductase [Sphingomonas sp.]|uniref:N-acetyl-gamma-glutamyl-phosphate reductase n=1 Tax=Sphingomonas sp. TaxID=28214 RepID=UPI0035C7D3B9